MERTDGAADDPELIASPTGCMRYICTCIYNLICLVHTINWRSTILVLKYNRLVVA